MEKWRRNSKLENEWELIFPHSRSGSFDACILGNPKVFHGCWRYDDNCCRDIRYCGNNAFIRGLAGLLSAAAASVKRNTTHGLYISLCGSYTKYSPQVYFNRCCIYLIMLTIMLIADGSTRIMSYGNQMTRGSSVYDFTVTGNEATVENTFRVSKCSPMWLI